MNGVVFDKNPRLLYVYLHGNDCINHDYDSSSISILGHDLEAHCKFDEEVDAMNYEQKIALLEAELRTTRKLLDTLRTKST